MINSYKKSSLRDRLGKILSTNKLAVLMAMALVLLIGAVLLGIGYMIENVILGLMSILIVLLMIWVLLWLRRSSWREFGLKRPRSWIRTVLIAIGGVVAIHILVGGILSPIVINLTREPIDISRFDALRGNLSALIAGLLIVWTIAAFGEEMIFRGYIMNRLASLFKKESFGWIISLIISSILFGIGHFYQGISGAILTGIVGVIYCLAYLVDRCNLWVPILIHGLYDTSAFLIIFFNLDKAL